MGFDVDKPKNCTKSKIPRKRIEQIEQYVEEIDDNAKQFARELNDLQRVKTIEIMLCFKI